MKTIVDNKALHQINLTQNLYGSSSILGWYSEPSLFSAGTADTGIKRVAGGLLRLVSDATSGTGYGGLELDSSGMMVDSLDNSKEWELDLGTITTSNKRKWTVSDFDIDFNDFNPNDSGLFTMVNPLIHRNPYTTKTANYTLTATDKIVKCTGSSAFTITALSAIGITGQEFIIDNASTASITLLLSLSQTINGDSSWVIVADTSLRIYSDGANWRII